MSLGIPLEWVDKYVFSFRIGTFPVNLFCMSVAVSKNVMISDKNPPSKDNLECNISKEKNPPSTKENKSKRKNIECQTRSRRKGILTLSRCAKETFLSLTISSFISFLSFNFFQLRCGCHTVG